GPGGGRGGGRPNRRDDVLELEELAARRRDAREVVQAVARDGDERRAVHGRQPDASDQRRGGEIVGETGDEERICDVAVSSSPAVEGRRAHSGGTKVARDRRRLHAMMAIVVILVILWLLGIVTKTPLGGLLHILLVIAIVFLLINVIRGRGI